MKPAIFHAAALRTIREFPSEVRWALGEAIYRLQQGQRLTMPLSREMPSVALGAAELRVRQRDGTSRCFYYVRSVRGILVFHAFQKKSQATPVSEIETGRKRLTEMLP